MVGKPTTIYLTNKELLSEIHKSKKNYSYYVSPEYGQYDWIIHSLDEVTPALIQQVREKRATAMMQLDKLDQKAKGLKNHQIKITPIDPESIKIDDLVWRLMTYDHIPLDPLRTKHPKTISDHHTKTNFPPYQHFIFRDDEFIEVGRSHWKNGLANGEFSQEHGKISNKLAMMFMKLVERYSQKANWRGYTYVDEMRSQALLQLSMVGLQFDESRSENPFAYYTVTVSNAFTRVLNLEKRNQNIRDDILVQNGVAPSMTRQIENELQQKAAMEAAEGSESMAMAPATKPGRSFRNTKKPSTVTSYNPNTMWEAANKALPTPVAKNGTRDMS